MSLELDDIIEQNDIIELC